MSHPIDSRAEQAQHEKERALHNAEEVFAPQASDDGAHIAFNKDEVARTIAELEKERASQGVRKLRIEARLAIITRSIRGRRLQPQDYRRLCSEQVNLINENRQLMCDMADAKFRLHRLRCDLHAANKSAKGDERPDRLAETNILLEKILYELQIRNERDELHVEMDVKLGNPEDADPDDDCLIDGRNTGAKQ